MSVAFRLERFGIEGGPCPLIGTYEMDLDETL